MSDRGETKYKPAPDLFLYDFKESGLEVILTVVKGKDKPLSVKIEDTPFIIGRDEDADMRLTDESVSRMHAIITYEKGCLYIRDENSSNGTYLNGKRIQKEELKDKDILRMGDTTIKVEVIS